MQARWSLGGPLALDRATIVENRELLAQFGRALLAVDSERDGGNRTLWTFAGRLDPFNQSNALDAATTAGVAADAVALVAFRLPECGVVLPCPGSLFQSTVSQLSNVKALTCTDEMVVGAALHDPLACADLLAAQRVWQATRDALTGDVDKPDTVTRAAAEALQAALLIDRCPTSSADADRERRHLEELLNAWTLARRDIERVSDRLACKLETTVRTATDVLTTMTSLKSADPSISSLYSPGLLDDASDSAIAVARREVEVLITELNALTAMTGSDTLSTDASELDALAERLESTGAIARWFSGPFKAAQRQASRLLADPADRLATASALRRTATFVRQRRAFHENSKARIFFSPMSWDGISSNFTALAAAHTLTIEAIDRLAAVDETQVLRRWLADDATERQAFLAACERLAAPLGVADGHGLAAVPLCDVESTIAARIHALSILAAAANKANVRTSLASRSRCFQNST